MYVGPRVFERACIAWDGSNHESKLLRLSAEDGVHYVFCPADSRVARGEGEIWQPAGLEHYISIDPSTQTQLSNSEAPLLELWWEHPREPTLDPRVVSAS